MFTVIFLCCYYQVWVAEIFFVEGTKMGITDCCIWDKKRVTICTKILIIHKIYSITFNMNPKNLFVTLNGVFFITNGLNTDATWKLYYHRGSISYLCLSFGKQLARSLQVTGFKSCFSYGVCFVYIKHNNYFLN